MIKNERGRVKMFSFIGNLMRKIGIVKLSLLLFILIPVGTATIMHFSYLTPPYETVKEFLNILIEITGILFGIGGIFATFLLKMHMIYGKPLKKDMRRLVKVIYAHSYER